MFQIADSTPTWSSPYAVDGTTFDSGAQNSRTSWALQGSFHFLKLCLYYAGWREDWTFVLELLHSKLDQWLNYLESSKHMNNLWVEKEHIEAFRPHDTSARDGESISREYPHYYLGDAMELWLALLQIERLIQSLEEQAKGSTQPPMDNERTMVKEVRESFNAHQDTLSSRKIRSNILETFTVPVNEARSSVQVTSEPIIAAPGGFSHPSIGGIIETPAIFRQSVKVGSSIQVGSENTRAKQAILLRRSIKEHDYNISCTDLAVIEAALLGFFHGPEDYVDVAWRKTMKMQKERDVLAFLDPRGVSLTLFAAKYKHFIGRSYAGKLEEVLFGMLNTALYDSGLFTQTIVDSAPGPINSWSIGTYETMSLLLAALSEPCREVL